ncbi:N-acetylated-alpha-linked acidic dipeptidase 2-like, partial [Tropilaelaps mercedesae]
ISYVNKDYLHNRRIDPKPSWFRTQFDSLKKVQPSTEPNYRHYMAVEKVVAELVRDLTDSLFLPFNLLEYAVTLQSYADTAQQHFTTVHRDADPKIFEPLQHAVGNFALRAAEFHHRQDILDLRDPMAIRIVNDQLLLLERAFLRSCPNQCFSLEPADKARDQHVIATPGKSYPQLNNIFPSVLDLIASWLTDPLEYDEEIEARMTLLIHDLTEIITTATASLQVVESF